MTKPTDTQALEKKNHGGQAYYGQQSLGCSHTRPDGQVVKVTMLDPRDPGYGAEWQTQIMAAQAKRGSDMLLAALRKARYA